MPGRVIGGAGGFACSPLVSGRQNCLPHLGNPGNCGRPKNFTGIRRKRLSHLILIAAAAGILAGCARSDMQDQPKYKAQRGSDFFADGRSGRPEVDGTIARGSLDEDTAYYQGKDAKGDDIDVFPIAVDKAFIQRGQQRFDAFCAPCHGRIGNGLGMIVRRGFKQPPSYHIDRLREAPVGHFFDVISNGYGAMLNYAQQLQVRDRWAIVAYIRALQYSQNASVNDLTAEARARVPGAGQPLTPEQKAAEAAEPITPRDSDFYNFPAVPATPSGVPGVSGAGAAKSNQPERK
jgi:mono/diheme cytochrome c family protein